MERSGISVAVLCGGKSRRMGRDKAKLYIGEKTFLERLIPVLKEKGLRIAVVKHDGHRFEIDHAAPERNQ